MSGIVDPLAGQASPPTRHRPRKRNRPNPATRWLTRHWPLPTAAAAAVPAGIATGLTGTPTGIAAGTAATLTTTAAAAWLEHRRARTGRIRATHFRQQWATAFRQPPRLRHIRATGHQITGTIALPRNSKITWEQLAQQLDPETGTATRQLRLPTLGVPHRITISGTHATVRHLTVAYRPAPIPDRLPPPGDHPRRLTVGWDPQHEQWVTVDLDINAHINIGGPTGTGKGVALRMLKAQIVERGWDLLLIDGSAAPEHSDIDTYQRSARATVPTDPGEAMAVFDDLLDTFAALAEQMGHRGRVMDEHGADKIGDLPPPARDQTGRPLVVMIDELSALIDTAKQLDRPGRDARKISAELVAAIDRYARLGRKYQFHLIVANQLTPATTIPRSTTAQLTWFLALGNLAPEHQKMIGGRGGWPQIPDRPGSGLTGTTGAAPTAVTVPLVTRDDITATINQTISQERPPT